MFFKHSKNGVPKCHKQSNGVISVFPESPVNPLYKPRTLGELKALFHHTGINPAPVSLRDGIKEVEGIDAMDSPSVPIGGDTFANIRTGKQIQDSISEMSERVKKNQPIKSTDSKDVVTE